jgi:dolichol-phosphate mannosyltransferase
VTVTGGGGFVGANLIRRLVEDGHEVHALVRPGGTGWRLEEVGSEVRRHEADLRDREAVRRAVAQARPEWVFHLAAYGASSWQRERERILATNLMGLVGLVEAAAAAGAEVVVNSGSSSEYGFKDHAPREDELPEPNSDYAVSKAAATLFCGHAARTTGLRIPTLRLYSAYGPFEEPRRLIPALIVNGLRGRLPPLADPDVARDFVHVDDVVDAYLIAAAGTPDPAGVYNVASGVQTTIREAVEVARRVLGIEAAPDWGTMERRSWDTNVWVGDPGRIRELGWRARLGFEEGFARTAAWLADGTRLRRYEELAGNGTGGRPA